MPPDPTTADLMARYSVEGIDDLPTATRAAVLDLAASLSRGIIGDYVESLPAAYRGGVLVVALCLPPGGLLDLVRVRGQWCDTIPCGLGCPTRDVPRGYRLERLPLWSPGALGEAGAQLRGVLAQQFADPKRLAQGLDLSARVYE